MSRKRAFVVFLIVFALADAAIVAAVLVAPRPAEPVRRARSVVRRMVVVTHPSGVELFRDGQPLGFYGTDLESMEWDSSGERALVRTPRGSGIARADDLDDGAGYLKLEPLPVKRDLSGARWAPDGRAFLVPESSCRTRTTTIVRVPLDGAPATDVFTTEESLDWFLPFVAGEGARLSILFASSYETYLWPGDGRPTREVLDLASLDPPAWSTGATEAFAFEIHVGSWASQHGHEGVFLCRPEAPPASPGFLKQLSNETQAREVSFSPGGRFVCWSSASAFSYRPYDRVGAPAIQILRADFESGDDIDGFVWDAGDLRVAIVAGDQVYVHDTATKKTTLVASAAQDAFWQGSKLVFTASTSVGPVASFVDMAAR